MRSSGIPPRTTSVHGGFQSTGLVQALLHQVLGSGVGTLPLTPEETAKLTPYPLIQFLEDVYSGDRGH